MQVDITLQSFSSQKIKAESARVALFNELQIVNCFDLYATVSQSAMGFTLLIEDFVKMGKDFFNTLALFLAKKFFVGLFYLEIEHAACSERESRDLLDFSIPSRTDKGTF